ncbi:MAG: HEPN domain-containing protein [Bacteroidales bacterium]|nr:HEPN domain-containing protein [Bacteroidales bacterium]MDD3665178.1 HEPN domain-containing protein [Bacteroidales bacterium]
MNAQIEAVKPWIEKADHDLGSAKIIFLHLPEYFEIVAFHCQQAVEKYIKALLVYHQVGFLKSHDLLYLLDALSGSIVIDESRFKRAFILNNFSVQIRYPNSIVKLTANDLETAINIADEFRWFTLQAVGLEL